MIDINKKYRTRDGREVRIYALDGGGALPVQGACRDDETGVWVLSRWKENGRISLSDFPSDLVEVKPRIQRTVWANLYTHGRTTLGHPSKEDADRCADRGRHACVKVEIDCEEGEGI
jgi:phage terminase large subunit GpA-like protein